MRKAKAMMETNEFITVGEFVDLLTGLDMKNARDKGFIEAADELNWGEPIERRSAARILHEYMKKELGIKDLPDISPAEELKDLYDCRICVNHIAQVYLRYIMDGVTIEGISEKPLKIFDGKGHLIKAETEEIKGRLGNLFVQVGQTS